jgi:hypothetical protein
LHRLAGPHRIRLVLGITDAPVTPGQHGVFFLDQPRQLRHRVRRQPVIQIEVHHQRRGDARQRQIPCLIDGEVLAGRKGFGIQAIGRGIAAIEHIDDVHLVRLGAQIVPVPPAPAPGAAHPCSTPRK